MKKNTLTHEWPRIYHLIINGQFVAIRVFFRGKFDYPHTTDPAMSRLSETHRLAWLSVPTLRFACVGLLKIQPLRGFIGTIFDYPHTIKLAMSRLSETH
ncbi:MAG: hypothetical protein J6I49_02880 [Bacteroidales bacterium]|nr:hypothetical protein [Bacteroidales bacterium]